MGRLSGDARTAGRDAHEHDRSTTDWPCALSPQGVDPHDDPAAVRTWQWLRWPMAGAMLLLIPAFYLGLTGTVAALAASRSLYLAVGLACACVLGRMLALSRHPARFLCRNAMDMGIALAALMSVFGGATPWSAPEWMLRLGFMSVVAARIFLALQALIVPGRLVLLMAFGATVLALAGAGFYWLEPRVHTYAEGLWLAFESSATVGYGDIAPTTPASRVFAVFVVLLGYGMLSLTFASIAALVIGGEEKQLRRDMHKDIKRLEREMALMRDDVRLLRDALTDRTAEPVRREPAHEGRRARIRPGTEADT
ncbi:MULTISPECIES: potassium channel family protein [unclassified Caballeronia]|uniref:potassium channel family protein n=1 Tax=unclassified Caballeronia TaxID=2646786 RepID=UPI002029A0E2|nr:MULTISPECIES: potassium channel family protein [unclassified Caballeronia]